MLMVLEIIVFVGVVAAVWFGISLITGFAGWLADREDWIFAAWLISSFLSACYMAAFLLTHI